MDSCVPGSAGNIAIRHSDLAVEDIAARPLQENPLESSVPHRRVVDVHPSHFDRFNPSDGCELSVEDDIAYGDIG